MTRYYLSQLEIEGFRGINNEGDPLSIHFKPDAVNSIFAPNAQGKSSIFEALCYAIKGHIPKLSMLPEVDQAGDYYCNRFHSAGQAHISIVLQPEDSSPNVVILLVRDKYGNRKVSSPSGHPNPEEILRSLDNDLCLLDQRTFLRFVEESPLNRGRAFSALLGIGRLSEVRQALAMLANTRTMNSDLGIADLVNQLVAVRDRAKSAVAGIAQPFEKLTGMDSPDPFDPSKVVQESTASLKGIDLIQSHFMSDTIATVDFDKVRETVRSAEQSDKYDKLTEIVKAIAALSALAPNSGEKEEQESIALAVAAREQALAATRGPLFKELYEILDQILKSDEWDEANKCPACKSALAEPLAPQIQKQLDEYSKVLAASSEISDLWATATWGARLRRLVHAPQIGADDPQVQLFARLDTNFKSGEVSVENLQLLLSLHSDLDNKRVGSLTALEAQKLELQKELPPSLVAITEKITYAEEIRKELAELEAAFSEVALLEKKLAHRQQWCRFITYASQAFGDAEVALSTQKTIAIESQYKDMYSTITNNPDVVPKLQKSAESEELFLLLEKFYGLANLRATTLLAESYRNALAISIFLSSALNHVSPARFVVLDDVTSSFDAGHQYALMELIRTKIARPGNTNGPQVIILSHDGLLEKYFDRLSSTTVWHHQRIQGLSPIGAVLAQAQQPNRLRQSAETFLNAGKTLQAEPLIRQYLEFKLLEIIRKVDIPVPLDFSIRDDKQMVQNCIDAIGTAVGLQTKAGTIILDSTQLANVSSTHVPALVSNWISHYSTGVASSLSPYTLRGVLDSVDKLADCFKYDCSCSGSTHRRYYKDLSSKCCGC
jgi:dsDNA-binding SOS-regulon protein